MRKIIGGFFLFVAICMLVLTIFLLKDEEAICGVAGAIFYGALGFFILRGKRKTPEEKEEARAEKERQKELQKRSLSLRHAAGLPLSRGVYCKVVFEESHISISNGGINFDLAYEKITNMEVRTDVNRQTYYVSDAGGAVAGNEMFGPLGALAFGGVEKKTSETIDSYFIVTYLNKDNKVNYLSFMCDTGGEALKVRKLIKQYKPKLSGNVTSFEL